MLRKLSDVMAGLPVERQAKIEALATKKIEDMLAEARTLVDFRRAVGQTQVHVAEQLGIKQNAVSQLEKRADIYVSTLQRFIESLGMKLELSLTTKTGTRIDLPNFHPWDEGAAALRQARSFRKGATEK